MNTFIIGYDKDDIAHQNGLIQFKSIEHAMRESDEYFNVTASSLELAKKEYAEQRSHYLTKIFM